MKVKFFVFARGGRPPVRCLSTRVWCCWSEPSRNPPVSISIMRRSRMHYVKQCERTSRRTGLVSVPASDRQSTVVCCGLGVSFAPRPSDTDLPPVQPHGSSRLYAVAMHLFSPFSHPFGLWFYVVHSFCIDLIVVACTRVVWALNFLPDWRLPVLVRIFPARVLWY